MNLRSVQELAPADANVNGGFMGNTDLTMRQQAALLTLMAEAREMTNAELKAVGKVKIELRDRERLADDLGFIQYRRDRQAYVHELTPAGWNWCDSALREGRPPPRSGPAGGALYVVLRGVHRNLKRSELDSSAAFFQPDPEQRVRAVYARFAGRAGALVGLKSIRARLSDLSREQLDAVLDVMSTRPDVRLLSQANRKVLTDEDREAAVMIGGQLKHILVIEPEPAAE